MSEIPTKHIDGDVAIGRNVSTGGDANIKGNARIGHNLVVNGWLEARNIKGPNKGLYQSYRELKAHYPEPEYGWYALVGDTLPADLYVGCGGDWVGTGEKAGSIEIDLSILNEVLERLGAAENEASTAMASAASAETNASDAKQAANTAMARAELALDKCVKTIPTIELNELDSMIPSGLDRETYDELVKNAPAIYIVTDNGYRIGVLEFFCDGSMRHLVTQKFSTHYTISNGDFNGSHSDNKVNIYWRSYNYNANNLENEKGTWGKWQEFNTEPAPNFSVETFYEISSLSQITLFPASKEELEQKPNGNREKNTESDGIVFNTTVNRFQHIIRSEEASGIATMWPVWVTNYGKKSAEAFGASADNGISAVRGRLYYCKKDGYLYILQNGNLVKVN